MSTCKDCGRAKILANWGGYTVHCHECRARLIASGPVFADAVASNALTGQYRNVLRTQFGDGWREGHERVKAWAELLKSARLPA